MHQHKTTVFLLFNLVLLTGCSASVLIPPLPGPLLVPSAISSIYTAYQISVDERPFQTIIEDEILETSIQSSILKEKELDILDLSTYSYNGNVYVIGTYDKKEDFKHLRKIVKEARKANSLTLYLYPEEKNAACGPFDDRMLQLKVKGDLLSSESVWGTNIAVKSVYCNIILL